MPCRQVHVREHRRHAPHGQMMIDVDDYQRTQDVAARSPPGVAELGPRDPYREVRQQEVLEIQAAACTRGEMTEGDDYRLERLEDDLIGDHNAEKLWAHMDQTDREWWLGPIGGVPERTFALEPYSDLPADVRSRLIRTLHLAEHHKNSPREVPSLKHDVFVTGDTYQHRQHLRSLGLMYDHDRGGYRGKLQPSASEDLEKDGLTVSPDTEFTEEERHASKASRAERRAMRYDQYAESARARGEAHLATAHERSDRIPMGQPILVGHHSERRHRSDLDKINMNYDKGFSEVKKAESYERRAKNLRTQGQHRKGDAEAARQVYRGTVKTRIVPGSRVDSPIYGPGTVEKVNRKSARVRYDSGASFSTDLFLLKVPEN